MKELFRGLPILGLLFCWSGNAADYIVKYKDDATNRLGTSFLNNLSNVKVLDTHEAGRLAKVEIANKSMEVKTLARLMKNPNVEYVVEDFKVHSFLNAPIDLEGLRAQWSLQKVHAAEAWAKAGNKGGSRSTVAIIDTGIDYNHESLKPNMVPGYDFKAEDSDPMDETSDKNPGHGTHCAGIVGSTGLVENGTSGMAPEVKMMPLRFLGADGSGDLMAGIKAIDYAIEHKVEVISASWGATVSASQAKPLIEAVERASKAGVIMVMAAANDGRSNDTTEVFPANAVYENTITVAASGPNDEKPQWSNFGKHHVSLASPGLDIMSSIPNNAYRNLSGTSMATPLVAGLVAWLKSQDATLTGDQIRSLLQTTGAKVSIETACNCRVDALSAIEGLQAKTVIVTPATWSVDVGGTRQFGALNAKAPLKFESSNATVASIDASGILKANAEGETTIKITDAAGVTASSQAIRVKTADSGGGGGGGGGCPFDDPMTCQGMCAIMPTLPWCGK
jgi:thermitase